MGVASHPPSESVPRPLSLSGVILSIGIGFISLAILNGLVLDFVRVAINPWLVLIATLAELAAAILLLGQRHAFRVYPQWGELGGFLVLVAVITAYLVYPALPNLVPPSHHFDAANHVVLATYIFDHHALPHDTPPDAPPFFMRMYPAGGALFDALVSHWVGSTPFRTLHIVVSLILALSAGLVFVLLNRLLPDQPPSRPIAFLATMLLFTAWEYYAGSVNERYFYAQVFSQFFALSVFFFASIYWITPDLVSVILMAMGVGMTFVTHPTAIVGAGAMAAGAMALRPGLSVKSKAAHMIVLGIGLLPVLLIYVIHHLRDWTALTGYGEAAIPTPQTIGLVLPVLGLIGALLALGKSWRGTFGLVLLFVAAILAQPAFLFVIQAFVPLYLPYFFSRSIYLMIYPFAMLSALPLFVSIRWLQVRWPFPHWSRLVWAASLVISAVVLMFFPPRPFAPITAEEVETAYWVKENLDRDNIGVISPVFEDAYWIQWAILEHPPSSGITADAYNLGSMTFNEWRENPGQPDYAIVRNLARLPSDPAVQVVYQNGGAAVLFKPRVQSPASQPVPPHRLQSLFADVFELVGYDAKDRFAPGSTLDLTLYWKPLRRSVIRRSIFVQILDSTGNVVTRAERPMLQKNSPTQRWPVGVTVADAWTLKLDRSVRPGEYTAEIVVFDQVSGDRLKVTNAGSEPSDAVRLGPLNVRIPAPTDQDLHAAQSVNAQFGDAIELRGVTIAPPTVHPGDPLSVTLYWRSLLTTSQEYTVFVHLLDSAGAIVTQHDAPPQSGTYPTTQWQAGETVQDPIRLEIPKNTPPGIYQLRVGLYTPADLKRLPVNGGDHVILPQAVTVK